MGTPREAAEDQRCEVLVVGAGPTGLALAAVLQAFGVSLRLVDAAADRVHESRALAMQPRTLELMRPLGLDGALVERGNAAVRLRIEAGGRVARAPLFDTGAEDTAFPFLLFISQAETEALLGEHLARVDVPLERPVTVESCQQDSAGVTCSLRREGGTRDVVRARYVVGCDGARSTVRQQAGIPFRGGRYPQTFLLADLAADGLEAGTVNAFLGSDGPVFFFPLGRPAPWRLITMRTPQAEATARVTATELQERTDRATHGRVRLGPAVWGSAFRIQHRSAARYRSGRIFLAGDAAHVHSPAGAQGMNTGIQDAVNVGWKLALACRGAPDELLDSYDAERRPVGEFVLRFTDRAFTAATSANPLLRAVRGRVVPQVLPLALRLPVGRRVAFRTLSQLGIRYRLSPAVQASGSSGGPPRAGDRLPDVRVLRAGKEMWLQAALIDPAFHLVLYGPADAWTDETLHDLCRRYDPLLRVHRLVPDGVRDGDWHVGDGLDLLADPSGAARYRLGVRQAAQLLVRPDGHIGYRGDGLDLSDVDRYLARWLSSPRATPPG